MTSFQEIVQRARNPSAVAIVLLLAWIATCDGEVSTEELSGLRSIASAGKSSQDLHLVVALARDADVQDLQLACEMVRDSDPAQRPLLLQMAIGMALEDGYLTSSEGHIVRFLADLLQLSPRDLDNIFREMTGENFPPAADPSSIDWWRSREHGRSRPADDPKNDSARPGSSSSNSESSGLGRLRDLAMLGLDEGATEQEIREAYRRLAKVHHPDRFSSLGPEAVQAANISFSRIQSAYERLIGT